MNRKLIKFSKAQNESLAKYLYDMSKLCFAGVLVEAWLKAGVTLSATNLLKSYVALVLGTVFLITALFMERKRGRTS